jgi:hypothetical protein
MEVLLKNNAARSLEIPFSALSFSFLLQGRLFYLLVQQLACKVCFLYNCTHAQGRESLLHTHTEFEKGKQKQ